MSPTHGPEANDGQRGLPPDHRCRVGDLTYSSVRAWFEDHYGRVPIQAAAALGQFMKAHGCSFAEAFTTLTTGGPIILVEPDPPPTGAQASR